MSHPVLLDNVEHADVTVAMRHGREFGDAVNQVLAYPTEFEQLQREYPILFRRDDEGSFYAVALLGLDRDENLFLDDEHWRARYVPAARQHGPLLLGEPGPFGDDELPIYIDLSDARVGAPGGVPLFRRHGGRTLHLERIIAALDVIRRGRDAKEPFFTAMLQCDLVQPVSLDIDVGEGTTYTVPNVFTVSQDRLAALQGSDLTTLHRHGFLRAAIMASASLSNVSRLIELKIAKAGVR